MAERSNAEIISDGITDLISVGINNIHSVQG